MTDASGNTPTNSPRIDFANPSAAQSTHLHAGYDPSQDLSSSEADIWAALLKLLQDTDSQPHSGEELSESRSLASIEPIAPPFLPQPIAPPPPQSAANLQAVTSSAAVSANSKALQPNSLVADSPAENRPSANLENLDESLLELQRLLFSVDQIHLNQLKERLENPARRAADVSEVLRQSIELHTLEHPQLKLLAAAIRPTVEQAIQDSVQQDETVMSSAIFPIVGPATRKAIAAALESTIQKLDQLLEYSLSPQALLWRLEALRSRRSFAEVVLMRTLQFRVEQVFLIHRETGLLLQEATAPAIKAQDPDLVSAMLGAIDRFVQDSFTVKSSESLDLLRFGELTLWIEQGPQAILAATVRGQAPSELRPTLQQAIEYIHRDHHAALTAFRGDAAPFAAALPQLEACLQTGYKTAPKQKGRPYFWALFVLLLTGLGLWGAHEISLRRRWAAYVDRLRAEPGIVVNRASREWDGFAIAGLRDPLAADPATLLAASNLDPHQVTSEWQPYLSLQTELLTRRARHILQPPATVTLRLDGAGILRAGGTAPLQWVQESRRLAPLIPGVTGFEPQVAIAEWQALRASQVQIEAQVLRFDEGETTLIPGQAATIARLVQEMQKATQLAAILDRQVQFQVIGRANLRGTPARNLVLSQERASQVVAILAAQGVNAGQLKAIGVGENQPLAQTVLTAEQINRSASFRLVFIPAARSTSGNPRLKDP